MENKKNNKIIVVSISAVLAIILLALFIFHQNWQKSKIKPTTNVAKTAITTVAEAKIDGIDHEPWDTLKKKYPDTVGYIEVPGTTIKDVTVQGKNNDYYLRRAPNGEYRYKGCYYIDYRCKFGNNMSQNTTIYGHNIDNINIFGQLRKFRDVSFYKKNPIIKFDTPSGVGEWKIFSVFLTNVEGSDGVIFNYRAPDYKNGEEFLKFVERSKRRSLINCPVDIKEDDKILTLSTCTYELKNWRLVVMARKIRQFEDKAVDVSEAVKNKDPLYPEAWYKKYGGTRPEFDDEPLL